MNERKMTAFWALFFEIVSAACTAAATDNVYAGFAALFALWALAFRRMSSP